MISIRAWWVSYKLNVKVTEIIEIDEIKYMLLIVCENMCTFAANIIIEVKALIITYWEYMRGYYCNSELLF